MKKRRKTLRIKTFKGGEVVVGIVNFQGKIILATNKAVYKICPETDKIKKIKLRTAK